MRIFKNAWFTRFARKEGISDDELRDVVNRLVEGQEDVDLGGHVYKQRIARPSEGKSGGYRVIVCFKIGFRTLFIYGFEKSDRANINRAELRVFKDRAKDFFMLPEAQIEARLGNGTLTEIF